MTNETLCIIILIAICVIALLSLWYKIQKDGLRETVVQLIVAAERTFASGEGKKKMEAVVSGIHEFIPFPLSIILTETAIASFCQMIFDEVKEALNYKAE